MLLGRVGVEVESYEEEDTYCWVGVEVEGLGMRFSYRVEVQGLGVGKPGHKPCTSTLYLNLIPKPLTSTLCSCLYLNPTPKP